MIALASIIIICIILYNIHINIELGYRQKDNNNQAFILITILKGLIKYRIRLPYINVNMEEKNIRFQSIKSAELKKKENNYNFKEFKQLIKKINYFHKKYKSAGKYMIDKVEIRRMLLNAEFDTENAAITGIVFGMIHVIIANIMSLISHYKHIETYELDIKPLFSQQNILYLNFSCIIRFKLGQIINVSIKILKLYLKGGD